MTSTSPHESSVAKSVITKSVLETAIKVKEDRDDVKIVDFLMSSDSTTVIHYSSAIFSAIVTVETGGSPSIHKLIIKSLQGNDAAKQWALTESMILQKEIMMYSQFIPALCKFQKKRCGLEFGPSVPVYYHSVVNSSTGIIILQNHQHDGYINVSMEEGVDYEHCKLVMKEMAVFHALSWAIKDRNPDNLKRYPLLFHDFMKKTKKDPLIDQGISSFLELARDRIPDSSVQNTIAQLQSQDLYGTMLRLVQPVEPFAVVCHGDLHCNNMLFKYDLKTGNKIPRHMKLIDLQMIRYALPTSDLSVFFYSSTTRTIRKRHLKDLLRLYHTEFINCLKKLGLEFPEFTFKVLEGLFLQSILLGVLMSSAFLPVLLCRRGDVVPFTGDSEEDRKNGMRAFMKRLPQLCDKAPIIQERLFDNLRDLAEIGSV